MPWLWESCVLHTADLFRVAPAAKVPCGVTCLRQQRLERGTWLWFDRLWFCSWVPQFLKASSARAACYRARHVRVYTVKHPLTASQSHFLSVRHFWDFEPPASVGPVPL